MARYGVVRQAGHGLALKMTRRRKWRNFEDVLADSLRDPEVRAEWEHTTAERERLVAHYLRTPDRTRLLLLDAACGLTRHMQWAPDVVAGWWYEHVCMTAGALMDRL